MNGAGPQKDVHRLATHPVTNNTRNEFVPAPAKLQIPVRGNRETLDQRRGPLLRQCWKAPVAGSDARQPGRLPGTKVENAASRAVAEHRLRRRHDIATRGKDGKMRHRTGEKAHIVIGYTLSLHDALPIWKSVV